MKVLVIVQMLAKLNFFLRIYDKYGLLVNLITTCFKDIVPFVVYMITWLLSFVMAYKQIGIKAPLRKGFQQDDFFGILIYVWQNSIGNIDDPDSSSFVNDPPTIQIYIIWFVWTLNQFVIVIILLNFLIAVISQSYENVMNSKSIKKYKDIAHLNKEAFLCLETIKWFANHKSLI